MKRTREWWARLSPAERSELVQLEANAGQGTRSAYIPDDCTECGHCSTPFLGSGLCLSCSHRHEMLVGKASLTLPPGTQVIYVPDHANNDVDYPSCEAGFITSFYQNGCDAFCRYWWSPNAPYRLRTTAHSELTPLSNLVIRDTVPQSVVTAALKCYG